MAYLLSCRNWSYAIDLENGGYGIRFGDAGLLDMEVVPFLLPCDYKKPRLSYWVRVHAEPDS